MQLQGKVCNISQSIKTSKKMSKRLDRSYNQTSIGQIKSREISVMPVKLWTGEHEIIPPGLQQYRKHCIAYHFYISSMKLVATLSY